MGGLVNCKRNQSQVDKKTGKRQMADFAQF
jgi:hypothetical protein